MTFYEKQQLILSLDDYRIDIGVITGVSNRSDSAGITNAELMYIHENGSPLHNVPARPVLGITIDYAQRNLVNPVLNKIVTGVFVDNWNRADIERELNKLCIRMQNYVRKGIRDGSLGLTPNKQSTINAKGSDLPLLDTGQLSRSIVCILRKV